MNLTNLKQFLVNLFQRKTEWDKLRSYPILKDFTRYELFLFSQMVQERQFKQGEIIYQEQFPLAVIYLIEKGVIDISEDHNGRQNSFELGRHQIIGMIDIYTEDKRKGRAIAKTDSTLLAISHLDFISFVQANPRTGIKLLNNVCRIVCQFAINLQKRQEPMA